jgi:adenylate cyclase
MKALLKLMNTCISVLLIGIAGAFFSHTDMGSDFEEEVGLTWLLKFRGPLPPPEDIVLISIDEASAEMLHLPDDPEKWPRSFYAKLIEKINQQNPALIALNIHFGVDREQTSDRMLAQAMSAKKNVILSNYLKQKTLPSQTSIGEIRYEQVIEPTPQFNEAAMGTAPFPIPKSSSTVKEFWAYKHSAGDIPTFPVSIFQYFVIKEAYPEILQLLAQVDPALRATLPNTFDKLTVKYQTIQIFHDIQTAVSKDDSSLKQLKQLVSVSNYPQKTKQLLQSWLALMNAGERLYLNHYGDVGTITTVPFYQALNTQILGPKLFHNKIVMIGYSDSLEPEKQQGFYTAYSKASAKVISPIEIAATAVANLIDQSWLKPMPWHIQALLIFMFGLALSGNYLFFSYKVSLVLSLLLSSVYFASSLYLFSSKNIWLPLAIPALQCFCVLLWESTSYFFKVRKVSERYLPKEVFAMNARYPDSMDKFGTLMKGVCMATDAGQYTTLSETIGPSLLHKLMNNYYSVIFPRVKSRNGRISDVIGDAMLAVWASPKNDDKLKINATHAALEIKTALSRFNETSDHQLVTRMGLHFGEMRLGNVGASEHYEYRAVGDTVNTATRIEGLNKLLGTRILVSASVIEGLQGFFSRELGTFLLKGKSQPITVFELVATIDDVSSLDSQWPRFAVLFSKAYDLFKEKQWQKSLDAFLEIHNSFPTDGPTQFYIRYLQNQLSLVTENGNNDFAIIIDLGNITTLLL